MKRLTQHMGQYELLEQIGRGGSSEVYLANDPVAHRQVVIKLLREELANDAGVVIDFIQEASTMSVLRHPHICQVYCVGEQDGWYYIAMERLTGQTLAQRIEERGPLPESLVLQIGLDIVSALAAALQLRKIHGDIKPANIFITETGNAKVLDFGLSRLTSVGHWSGDGVLGSPHYMSPERVQHQTETFSSDMYSLGATLFHALTGQPPFEAGTLEDVALKRVHEPPPLVRALRTELAEETEQVVNTLLKKNPNLRPHDYNQLTDLLQQALNVTRARQPRTTNPLQWFNRSRTPS
jgi:serine/threonine-protein kinase